MAISIVNGNRGTATEKISDTSLSITTNAAMSAGNYALVAVVIDNIATVDGESTTISVSDGTHTYTRLREQTEAAGGTALAGVTSALFLAKLTSGLSSGATITITLTGNATAKGAGVAELSCAGGSQIIQSASGSNGESVGFGTAYSVALSSLTNVAGLYVGMVGAEEELDTAVTLDTGYSALSFGSIGSGTAGGNATNVIARVGTLAETSTGNTFDASGLTQSDKAVILVRLEEEASAAVVSVPNGISIKRAPSRASLSGRIGG